MFAFQLKKSHRLLIIIAISAAFFVTEISVGFHTRSLALVADAFHYMNDLLGYIVAYAAFRISERANSPKKLSFGWQRASLLGAFFNGVFLLALGVSILLQSIERFISIERIENPKLVLIVGCVGLTLNIISAAFLHEHQHDNAPAATHGTELQGDITSASTPDTHHTHRHVTSTDVRAKAKGHNHDLGLMGVLIHVLGDAANNVGVIIAAVVIWKARYESRYYADPAVSMAIALMILLSSLPLVKKTGTILLESAPIGVDPEDVKNDLQTIPGVIDVHELHIWLLNQEKAIASAHIVISKDTMTHFMELANTINECFHAYGIHSATLQPEVVSGSVIDNVGASPGTSIRSDEENLRRRASTNTACRIGCRTTTACEELTCCD